MINFYMTEVREIRTERPDGLPGQLLGRFLPGLSYRLTPQNKDHVEKWASEGAARMGVLPGSAADLLAGGGSVSGTVKT